MARLQVIYSTFKAYVATHLNRSDLTAQIPTFVNLALAKLEREPLYFLQTYIALSTTNARSYIALPTGFVQEARIKKQSAVIDSSGNWLERTPADQLIEYQVGSAGTGLPSRYAIIGNQLEFYPIPDAVYNLRFYYFKNVGAPAEGSENSWTTTAFDLLLQATLVEAWDFLSNDQELVKAEMKKTKLLNKLNSISGKLLGTGQVAYNEV